MSDKSESDNSHIPEPEELHPLDAPEVADEEMSHSEIPLVKGESTYVHPAKKVDLLNSENTDSKDSYELLGAAGPQEAKSQSESLAAPSVPTLTAVAAVPTAEATLSGKIPKRKRLAPVKTYWGGTAILSSAVVFLVIQIIIAVVLVSYILFAQPNGLLDIQNGTSDVNAIIAGVPLLLVLSQATMYLGWLGSMWWVTKYRSGVQLGRKFWTAFKENFWIKFKKRDLLIGAGIAAVMMGFQLVVLNVLPSLFPQINMEGAGNTSTFEALDGVWFFIIAFGIGSVIGPICEELFFRGFIMRGLLNHFSFSKESRNIDDFENEAGKRSFMLKNVVVSYRDWASKHRSALAIIISSIFFGFMHFQGSETFGQWLVVIVTGTLGLVLGFTTLKLQRILPAMVAHILYNTTSFVLLLVTMNS
jgi:membrane protease YdiL (CAAX protease family)